MLFPTNTVVTFATTFAPILSAQGSDTNISQVFQPKGTGAIDLAPGSSGVNISNGGTVTAITRTAAGRWRRDRQDRSRLRSCSWTSIDGQPALDVSLDALPTSALVSDAIYIPLETPLLEKARMRGNPTVNGLGMLLNQARPAFKAWFGVLPEITDELRKTVLATF